MHEQIKGLQADISSYKKLAGARQTSPTPFPDNNQKGLAERLSDLIKLCHPDRHHGGALEATANDITAWLIQCRKR